MNKLVVVTIFSMLFSMVKAQEENKINKPIVVGMELLSTIGQVIKFHIEAPLPFAGKHRLAVLPKLYSGQVFNYDIAENRQREVLGADEGLFMQGLGVDFLYKYYSKKNLASSGFKHYYLAFGYGYSNVKLEYEDAVLQPFLDEDGYTKERFELKRVNDVVKKNDAIALFGITTDLDKMFVFDAAFGLVYRTSVVYDYNNNEVEIDKGVSQLAIHFEGVSARVQASILINLNNW